jgi:hypothetical protein
MEKDGILCDNVSHVSTQAKHCSATRGIRLYEIETPFAVLKVRLCPFHAFEWEEFGMPMREVMCSSTTT